MVWLKDFGWVDTDKVYANKKTGEFRYIASLMIAPTTTDPFRYIAPTATGTCGLVTHDAIPGNLLTAFVDAEGPLKK